MSAELLHTLSTGNWLLSATTVLVLVLRQPLRRWLGARASYALWLALPGVLLASALPGPSAPIMSVPVLADAGFTMTGHWLARTAPELAEPLLVLWALGALALLGYLIGLQMRFRRRLGSLTSGSDGSYYSNTLDAPMLIGLWRPRVVLPADFRQRYSTAEQALVLAHEHAHQRHHDPLANALAYAVLCLFWCNPLLYWALSRFRFDQELACDARVIEAMPGARRRYASALLKTQLGVDATGHLPLGCHWQSCHPLKERITMLQQTKSTAARRAGLVIAIAFGLSGSYAVWAAQPAAVGSKASPRPLTSVQDEDLLTPPRYPKGALDQKIAGDVRLLIQVLPDGSVGEIVVESSMPQGVFDAAALEAARQWKLNPERRNGKPVVGWIKVPVHFDPAGNPDTPAAAK